MADLTGQQLGNYRLIRLLGQGGFAEVYLGEHVHLNTQAAVKVLYTHLASEDLEKFRQGTTQFIIPSTPSPRIDVKPPAPTEEETYQTVILASSPSVPTPPPALGTTLTTYRGHSAIVKTVAWAPEGLQIASGSNDHTVQIWDATTGAHIFTYRDHTASVNTVSWSPKGKYIASGSADGTVRVWVAPATSG